MKFADWVEDVFPFPLRIAWLLCILFWCVLAALA